MNTQKTPPTANSVCRRGWLVGLGTAAAGAVSIVGCDGRQGSLFTRLDESRSLAARLRLDFNKAADASNLAVMADTDEASVAFAGEAEEAKKGVAQDQLALAPLLQTLGYDSELRSLDEFQRSFAEYSDLDRAILALAVENSNLKATRLSFGPAREAAEAFRTALDSVIRASSARNSCGVGTLVYAAVVGVREIQALEAPHIAEREDAAMSKMEKEMSGMESSIRSAIRELTSLVEGGARADLAAASDAFDRFMETHAKVITLSRKNTNVRSLAMSLGQKRAVTTACDSRLASLQEQLAKKGLKATR